MMRFPEHPIVFDTTILPNFAVSDRMDLLGRLPRVVTVPTIRVSMAGPINLNRMGFNTHV